MKSICTAVLLALPFLLFSQVEIESYDAYPDIPDLEYVVDELDFDELETGLLWDVSIRLADLIDFDGQHLDSTNAATNETFSRVYATLYGSITDVAYQLPHPQQAYLAAMDTQDSNGDILIPTILYEYERLLPSAVDDGLLAVVNDQLVHTSTTMPYERLMAAASTCVMQSLPMATYTFKLPSSMLTTNLSQSVTSVSIDFDNGLGYSISNMDSAISHSFTTEGLKDIKVKFLLSDNTEVMTHFPLVITAPPTNTLTTKGSSSARYDPANSPNFFIALPGLDTAFVYTHCEDNVLSKPFIFVEGFNPEEFGNQSPQHMRNQFLGTDASFENITLLRHLEDNGYDLVYVDWNNPTLSIQDNAAVLEAVIAAVNARKLADSGADAEPNVVFGESMGGLIGKYCLLDMENRNVEHDVETLMTFDSPLRGANVPLALQFTFKGMAETSVNVLHFIPVTKLKDFWWTSSAGIGEAYDILHSPAVKQMLYYHVEKVVADNGGPPATGQFREDFLAELDALGEPQNFDFVALSNGSLIGQGNESIQPGGNMSFVLANSAQLAGYAIALGNQEWYNELWQSALVSFGSILATAQIRSTVNAVPDMPLVKQDLYSYMFGFQILGLYSGFSRNSRKIKGTHPVDTCPGGSFAYGAGSSPAHGVFFQTNEFTFIPTISALDIKSGPLADDFYAVVDDVATVTTGGQTSLRSYEGSIDDSVQQPNDYTPQLQADNQQHISFNERLATFFAKTFLGELRGLNNVNFETNLIGFQFNFGETAASNSVFRRTTTIIDQDRVFSGQSYLSINAQGRIGEITNTTNPDNTQNSNFDLFVVMENCQNDITQVDFFGTSQLVIGDNSVGNTAGLFIQEDSEVSFFENTAMVLDDESRLEVEEGLLTFHENSTFEMSSSIAEVHNDSEWLLDTQRDVIISASHIELFDNSRLTISNGSTLILDSGSKIVVNTGTELVIGDNVNLNLLAGSKIHIKQGGSLILGLSNLVDLETVASQIIIEGQMSFSDAKLTATGAGAFVWINADINVLSNSLTILRGGDLTHKLLIIQGTVDIVGKDVSIIGAWVDGGVLKTSDNFQYLVKDSKITATLHGSNTNTFHISGTEFEGGHVYHEGGFRLQMVGQNDVHTASHISAQEVTHVYIENTNFYNSTHKDPNYLNLTDIGRFANVVNCLFQPMLLTTPDPNLEVLAGFNKTPDGIYCLRTPGAANFNLVVDNSEFKYLNIAIDESGPVDQGINIFLRENTIIRDNHVGISMTGDEVSGMVDMSCSSLLRNNFGIQGRDILLNIDALLTAASTDGIVRGNTFVTNGFAADQKLLFDICFQRKIITRPIPARGNSFSLFNQGSNQTFSLKQTINPFVSDCDSGTDIALDMSMQVSTLCPSPMVVVGCPNSPLSQAALPNFNQMLGTGTQGGTQADQYLASIASELCLGTVPCDGTFDIHSYYWAGMQCLFNENLSGAGAHFYPVAMARYDASITLPDYCYQQSLVASHLLFDANSGGSGSGSSTTTVMPSIEQECNDDSLSIHILLDASGSVSTLEFAQMVSSVNKSIKNFLVPGVKYSVANFSGTGYYDRIVDLTDDLADTSLIVRTLYGNTNVAFAFQQTRNYMANVDTTRQSIILLYTDASSNNFNAPPFDIYNEVKSAPYNAEVIVVRYQDGSNNNALANTYAAAVASKGGSYQGQIYPNATDPEGPGGPRQLIAQTFTGAVPLSAPQLLGCDSLTLIIHSSCLSPSVAWSSSNGGAILGDSIGVTSIVTNGLGEYTATVTCQGGCQYVIGHESSSPAATTGKDQALEQHLSKDIYRGNPHAHEEGSAPWVEKASKINFYPVPARDYLAVEGSEVMTYVSVQDMAGKLVVELTGDEYRLTVDTQDLHNGVYILKVTLESGEQVVEKIVVQN